MGPWGKQGNRSGIPSKEYSVDKSYLIINIASNYDINIDALLNHTMEFRLSN
jgi:hypothetical protein